MIEDKIQNICDGLPKKLFKTNESFTGVMSFETSMTYFLPGDTEEGILKIFEDIFVLKMKIIGV